MTTFTVQHGRRYRASIRLGLFEQLADNATIAGMLRDAGFADVEVSGNGAVRTAVALWPHEDASGQLPEQIHAVVEIG